MFTELSAQSRIIPEEPILNPEIYYYGDTHHSLRPISGRFLVEVSNGFILGVVVDGELRPAYSRHCQMITVRIRDNRNMRVTLRQSWEIPYGQRPRNIYPAMRLQN